MKRLALIAGFATVAITAAPSQASAQSANSFITYMGLEWAWASPCASGIGSSCGLEVSLTDGWRYATVSEWASRPAPADFLDAGGNYLGVGGQMRCAAYFFGSGYSHCDYNDAVTGYVMSGLGNGNDDPASETWLVRTANEPPGSTVPEPATMLLLATGMAGIAGARHRKS